MSALDDSSDDDDHHSEEERVRARNGELYTQHPETEPRDVEFAVDMAAFGWNQKGEYRGFKWHAERAHHRRPWWNGYIDLGRNVTERDERVMCMAAPESTASTEATYSKGHVIGFDCNHCNDYPNGVARGRTEFRSFPFVRSVLHRTIDGILR